jgi:nucleoside-triphosphatase
MNTLNKNIFLTGPPSSGKTTVIKKVIEKMGLPAQGFYTEEERVAGRREGFMMKTLDGKTGYLAHRNIQSEFYIRHYGVSIENIETIAVPSITPADELTIIILDEIGKMECFSAKFRDAATAVLDAPNIVVGTITYGGDEFITEVKKRSDMEIHEVTPDNRDALPGVILNKIADLRLLKF